LADAYAHFMSAVTILMQEIQRRISEREKVE